MHSRAVEWLFPALALPLALLASRYGIGTPQAGQLAQIPITLIAPDDGNLQCAARAAAGRFRCAFLAPGQPASVPARDTLVPVSTTDGRLYLVAGLFTDAAVRARCDGDRARLRFGLVPPRFTADCRVRLVGEVRGLSLRWNRAQPWGDSAALWAVEAISCAVH